MNSLDTFIKCVLLIVVKYIDSGLTTVEVL